ncbi:MAG: UvrD-helicase domain-containing protein, partial [Lentisphaeria bacterium]|nr:UvrD-helicase domain-containing protein [Lentisphaeria bacterium]
MTAPGNTTHASAAAHRPFGEAVIDCPLAGVRLVEASAGTGKTFQIQTLFLRLVVQGITVDRILVVTFTEAATKELRDRLRSILVKARGHLDGVPMEAADNDFPRVTAILAAAGGDEAEHLQRLRAAVRDFDQAAIFTLHGFCARVLGEAAFECGLPFDTELAENPEGLMRQVVEDEFRTQIYTMPRLLAAAEVSKDVNFDTIGSLVKG